MMRRSSLRKCKVPEQGLVQCNPRLHLGTWHLHSDALQVPEKGPWVHLHTDCRSFVVAAVEDLGSVQCRLCTMQCSADWAQCSGELFSLAQQQCHLCIKPCNFHWLRQLYNFWVQLCYFLWVEQQQARQCNLWLTEIPDRREIGQEETPLTKMTHSPSLGQIYFFLFWIFFCFPLVSFRLQHIHCLSIRLMSL